MKTIVVICLMCVVSVFANTCPTYLLFKNDAHAVLDSLNRIPMRDSTSVDSLSAATRALAMAMLYHNCAFDEKNEAYIDTAANLLSALPDNPITDAYRYSLDIMRCDHMPFLVKAYNADELTKRVNEDYKQISKRLDKQPENDTLLFLHVGVTLEISQKFSDKLPNAKKDLIKLSTIIAQSDSAKTFFVYLLKAKYYYHLGQQTDKEFNLMTARDMLKLAKKFVTNSHHQSEISFWEDRLKN